MEEYRIDQITLASIASACNISKGTLYYHYNTKEDILFDIIDRFLAQQEQALLDWMNDQSKDTSLNRVLMYVLQRSLYEVGPRMQLYYAACFGNENLRKNILNRYKQFQSVISEKLLERDDFPEDKADYFSWLALLLADGLGFQNELRNPDFDADKFIHDTEQYFKNGPC